MLAASCKIDFNLTHSGEADVVELLNPRYRDLTYYIVWAKKLNDDIYCLMRDVVDVQRWLLAEKGACLGDDVSRQFMLSFDGRALIADMGMLVLDCDESGDGAHGSVSYAMRKTGKDFARWASHKLEPDVPPRILELIASMRAGSVSFADALAAIDAAVEQLSLNCQELRPHDTLESVLADGQLPRGGYVSYAHEEDGPAGGPARRAEL